MLQWSYSKFRRVSAFIVPLILLALFVPVAPVKALSPVFESTGAAKVTLGSLASRTQCTALGKQGIGPYTMTGTDATSNSSYSYVTDKDYTQTAQLYEGQESTTQNLSYSTSTGQTYGGRSGVIRLFSSGIISYANSCNGHGTYGSAFGPEIWTEPFPATANQSISFDWAAAGGGDDYEAYGYLVQVSASGNTYDYGSSATSTLVSYGRGQNQGWVTSSGTVPSTGYYRFRFVNGSYDATGGQVLGAAMYIDSAISVASANTITFAQPADIVTSSSNQTFTVSATATSGLSVTFTSSTTGKCTVGSSTDSGGTSTATVTVLASQTGTCTISANSSANNSYVAASTVSQSFTLLAGSTAPTTSGGTSMSGTVAYGNTLTAVDGTWGDGGSAVTATTYQWQSCDPASCTWTNISGATSSTYVVVLGDVAKQIRVAVTKTNSIGSLTANSSASITVPAPTSVIVANLSDTSDSGSLRWAITTANASATINTITFASGNTGTITLTSDLPNITDGVTITGTGMATTIIDGNNLWRAIYNNGSRTIVIEDMTFKQGKNVSWNGGLIYNGSGTMTFNRIKISNHSSWAFYQGGGGVTTFNDSQFNNNGYAITSDHGGTPSVLSLTDTDYSNRIYVNGSTFTSNTYGIRTERFVKINNSQFTGNTQFGAYLGGLNRQQVLNSSFTSNGTGVYFSSWIPTGWAVGAGNQTVSGNTFNGNTTAIQFANNWSGGAPSSGASANSFSTASGNTFGATASNATTFSGSGYVESNNTITAAYLNAVTNLTAVANADGSVDLDWDASAASNTAIYGYSVSFYDLTVIGGATSGGWGVWTNQGTNYSLSTGMFSGSNPVTTGYGPVRFGIKAMSGQCVGVGSGSCTYGPEVTVDATVLDPTTVTTTTSSTTTTTSTTVAPVVVVPPVDTTVPLPQYPEPETESTTVTLPVETEPETELPVETIPEYSEPVETEPIETEPIVVIIPPDEFILPEEGETISTGQLDDILEDSFSPNADAEGVGAVLDTLLGAELTDTQFDNVLEAVFTEDVSADVFTEALTTMLDADITSEQLTAVLASAFSEDTSAENMVAALESIFDGPISSSDLTTVMDAVFDEDISVAETMTVLGDLLETNLSQAEAEAVFDNVFDDDLSDAETIDLIVDVLEDGLTAENLGAALGAVFDEEVSTEVLVETFTAVLDGELNEESLGVIVDVLESDTITSEQVGQVVTLVIEQEGGIPSDQATELATSAKVLESIDGEQATEVFAAIVVAEVSEEAGAEISEALTEAPTDVKESFEEEINVFAGVFDTYVALGSEINVGDRRTVIAVGAAVSLAGAAVALGGASPPSGGGAPSGGSGSPSGQNSNVARKPEEEEMNGELAWDGVEWITQLSIFRYNNGVKILDWGLFMKKFTFGLLNLGFTISGSLVVYLTLSGTIQRIAGISSVIAFMGAMYLHMREPDNN